ncbi:MAG TPA: sulfotransferase family protein [Caulobacteraceae bacterium]|jgi:hypothetical protein
MSDNELADAIGAAIGSGRLNMDDTWVSRRQRYFYMGIPKVASSKVKMVLHQLEGYPLPRDPFDVHARSTPGVSFVDKLSAFSSGEAAEILAGPDWYRFAFVRNPYARLYSAYKSKIADLTSPYIGVRKTIWELSGKRSSPDNGPPFDAFVRYVVELPDPSRDGHWRSQTGILCLDLIDYGFLARFERFGEDFAIVLRSLGAPDDLRGGLDLVVNASATPLTERPYNAALAQLVYEAYAADFEAFGYARASWSGGVG